MRFDFDIVKKLFLDYGLKILIALGVMLIGVFLIRIVKDILDTIMKKKGKDHTLRTFTVSLVNIILKLIQ